MDFFNPFEGMIFDRHFCFLTGDLTTETMTVFPQWLMDHFGLGEEKIKLMENSKVKQVAYADLKVPCVPAVKSAFADLDEQFQNAYKMGYEGVAELDEQLIFLWSGRIVYGLLYLELAGEMERHQKIGKEFKISKKLAKHLGQFHLMLQSVVKPISFGERKPWSIVRFPLKYSADILSFRDDVTNLLFQFGVNGFGFIVCFKDNGGVAEEQSAILEKIKGYTLHPIQFEELYARLHYTADLLQYLPKYEFTESESELKIESLPVEQINPKLPLFGYWTDDTYAQLLANYWQVYGIEKEHIIQFHKPFLSFLEDPYSKDFIDPKTIKLPF